MTETKETKPIEQYSKLLQTLEDRFTTNMCRHPDIQRSDVAEKLLAQDAKLVSLSMMEQTGGTPDVVGYTADSGNFMFIDCSPESPEGRRSLCYDKQARETRKKHKPSSNVIDTATEMGIELLTVDQYHMLQQLGAFDTKTSSRVSTPEEIRKRGGALFCDRRYETVFTYHNGADSYYAARGFRGILTV